MALLEAISDRPDSFTGRALRVALARSSQFVLLAFLLAAANTFASTLAASVFLSHVGSAALPIYYIGFAALSIPISFVFSSVIDRWPRARTMTALLTLFMGVSLVLTLVIGLWPGRVAYYALYVGISMSELLLYSVYYVLLADHFTTTETKRLTSRVAMAMALGGLAGGSCVGIVVTLIDPMRALYGIPLLVGLVIAHLSWLTRREQPLDEMESAAEEGVIESLRILPRLARRYPMVTLLAIAVFLNIFLQCILEFVVFSIYAATYPEPTALASFLGIVNAGLNLAGVAIVLLFTERFMPRLGVARMNLVYPLLTFGSFALLSTTGRLPAAIAGHVAYDPFEHSIDVPVFTMNYNAIPHRFVGRVRVINDGVVYPLALAASGIALLLIAGALSLSQISMIGAGLSLVFVLAHWGIGKAYLRGLITMLRSGTIDLDQAGEGFRLPVAYEAEVAAMLASGDKEMVSLGLEITARCGKPPMQPEIERVLPLVSGASARMFLGRLARHAETSIAPLLEALLGSADPVVRAHAIEAMAVHGLKPTKGFAAFFDDVDEAVRVVAAAASLATDPQDKSGAARILDIITEEEAGIGVVNVLRNVDPRVALPLLEELAGHPMAAVRAAALRAATVLARPSDVRMLAFGWCYISDEEPSVRAAAIGLLAAKAVAGDLDHVARTGFRDHLPEVRQATSRGLASRGAEGLEAARPFLVVNDPDIVDAAIDTIGAVGGKQADDILFDFLNGATLPMVASNATLSRAVPADRPGWNVLGIAIADSNERAVHLVLHSLSALGYRRTVNVVRTMLAAGDARMKANAIESLSSLAHRRFVLPLLPLLENEGPETGPGAAGESGVWRRTLEQALGSTDHWIRAGAVIAWHAENGFPPVSALTDFHPIVADTAGTLLVDAKRRKPEDLLMNRIAFLKSVPLFAGLSLDNLVAIEEVLAPEAYLEGEPIVIEGEVGDRLFIVYQGEVRVTKRMDNGQRELARLDKGAMFGEMSLFDDEPRSATVSAANDTEVLALERERFYSLVQQRPQILMQMCKVLVNRLRVTIS